MAKKKKGYPVVKGVAGGLLGAGGLAAGAYGTKRYLRARVHKHYDEMARLAGKKGHMGRVEIPFLRAEALKKRIFGIPGTSLKRGKLYRGTTKYLGKANAARRAVIARLLKLVRKVPK